MENSSPPLSDPEMLRRVTERVFVNGHPEDRKVPTPLLTLVEFFEGNREAGSIGCNLDCYPDPAEFYRLLREISERPDVSDIRMQITCVDTPGVEWPFSDTIWIMTSAGPKEVMSWFPAHLSPSECWSGWISNYRYEPVDIKIGHAPIAAWYD